MLHRIIITLVGTAALGSVLIGTGASAAESPRHHLRHLWNYVVPVPSGSTTGILSTGDQCKVVGAISHRCYTFDSDATWPDGLSDYHGSN
jgi:hypothetical protein